MNVTVNVAGDFVLVTDVALSRNQWPLGRVVDVNRSDDGRVQSVKIRVHKTQLQNNNHRASDCKNCEINSISTFNIV